MASADPSFASRPTDVWKRIPRPGTVRGAPINVEGLGGTRPKGAVHDPTDPVGRLFNVLAMVAEFEGDHPATDP